MISIFKTFLETEEVQRPINWCIKVNNMEEAVKQYEAVYNTDGDKLVFNPEIGMYSVAKENEDIGDNYQYRSKEVWSISPTIVEDRINQGILSYDAPKTLVENNPTETEPSCDCEDCLKDDLEMELERLSYKVGRLENKIDELINLLQD